MKNDTLASAFVIGVLCAIVADRILHWPAVPIPTWLVFTIIVGTVVSVRWALKRHRSALLDLTSRHHEELIQLRGQHSGELEHEKSKVRAAQIQIDQLTAQLRSPGFLIQQRAAQAMRRRRWLG